MALVITVAQQKGGSGKTSVAAHLACAWAGRQLNGSARKLVLIDLDPQESLTTWFRLREEKLGPDANIALKPASGWRATSEIQRAGRDADIIIVDSPPQSETSTRIAIRAADIIIVPCQLSPLDVWASRPILEMIARENRSALVVLNRVPARANHAEELVSQLKRDRVPLARAALGNRVAFTASLMEGLGVVESDPHSVAAAEIRLLASEVLRKVA
ncbi:MAG: ParA family protein [Alphaproteobacteria bacterium]|nr:ParA family protein [Alphaproteobacteria bacterium]